MGFVGPAPPAFDERAEERVRLEVPEGVGGAADPFLSVSLAKLLLVPFKLVSDERVLRFKVAAAAEASVAVSEGEGRALSAGVVSVCESS